MLLSQTRGQLMIIGGAEDKTGECKILREFLRCAGGLKARIVVMTAATELSREVAQNYIKVFEQLGVAYVRIVDTVCREDASSSSALLAIENATGVFFTGGNQASIASIIKDTEIDAAIHKRFSEGMVVAGTSAGAAVMPDMMIVEGESETNPRVNVVEMQPGMGFLPGVVVDQHFAQRGRLGRLISALVIQSAVLGLGIDENTAVLVDGKEFEVIGEGAVTVIDVAEITHSNLEQLLKDEAMAICGAKLHILPQGYRFDLETRSPILAKVAVQAA